MMLMDATEVEVPSGVEARIESDMITIKGKLGSTSKKINPKLFSAKLEPGKIILEQTKNKKLAKKADLAIQAFASELKSAGSGVQSGIEKKMVVFFSHFPITIEVKGKVINIKNIFGERVPRSTSIIGDTKVEVKGQEVIVKGVDAYDVGQTVANIRKACYSIGDTRVFQDGLYVAKSE